MKLSTLDKISRFLAELIGTGMLVFLGCMGCINTNTFPNTHFQSAINFGLVILVIVQCFGCVSGSHLNPAVTVAAYVYKQLNLTMAAVYFCAQMLGGFIGYGLLKAVVPANVVMVPGANHGLCVTVPHREISNLQALAIEFIITSILIMVCCGVWDPRNANHHDSVPLRFGLIISCLAFTAGGFTGASMNPARSFGPALWNADFESHWIYWLGPMSAALITAVAYKTVFWREAPEEVKSNKLRAMEELPLS